MVPLILAFGLLVPQQQQKQQDKQKPPVEVEPPEEDESLIPEQCVLNPLEATRNITAGNFYYKKGNFRAAANRYKRAACWDPGSTEAFLKLGESDEKLKDIEGAREAYKKYLELAPDAKNSGEIKKKLAKFPPKK